MKVYRMNDTPSENQGMPLVDTFGIRQLLAQTDFTDEEIDVITSLDVGETWEEPRGAFTITRLPDEPAKLPQGRIDDPLGA